MNVNFGDFVTFRDLVPKSDMGASQVVRRGGRNRMNNNRRALIPVALAVVILLSAAPAQAVTGERTAGQPPVPANAAAWAADYEQLGKWEFSGTPIPLPEGGVRLQRDSAEWYFESGTVRPMRPTSDGSVTGLVFEGQGRFRMEVPDPVEVNQFPRFFLTPGEEITPPETLADGTIEYRLQPAGPAHHRRPGDGALSRNHRHGVPGESAG